MQLLKFKAISSCLIRFKLLFSVYFLFTCLIFFAPIRGFSQPPICSDLFASSEKTNSEKTSAEVRNAEALIEGALTEFPKLKRHFNEVAEFYGATFKARIKESGSLLAKILIGGRKTRDVMGFRFVAPLGSVLHSESTEKEWWSKILNIRADQIDSVEFKGGPADRALGRYYKATHIDAHTDDGNTYEIQIMTPGTAFWSAWDHPTVYKARMDSWPYENGGQLSQRDLQLRSENQIERDQLKMYSSRWLKVILEIEQGKSDLIRNSILNFDIKLRKSLNIRDEDGIFYHEIQESNKEGGLLDYLRGLLQGGVFISNRDGFALNLRHQTVECFFYRVLTS